MNQYLFIYWDLHLKKSIFQVDKTSCYQICDRLFIHDTVHSIEIIPGYSDIN